jgi:hypothetical protein
VNVEEEDWSMGEDVSLIYKPMQGRWHHELHHGVGFQNLN